MRAATAAVPEHHACRRARPPAARRAAIRFPCQVPRPEDSWQVVRVASGHPHGSPKTRTENLKRAMRAFKRPKTILLACLDQNRLKWPFLRRGAATIDSGLFFLRFSFSCQERRAACGPRGFLVARLGFLRRVSGVLPLLRLMIRSRLTIPVTTENSSSSSASEPRKTLPSIRRALMSAKLFLIMVRCRVGRVACYI